MMMMMMMMMMMTMAGVTEVHEEIGVPVDSRDSGRHMK